MKVCLAAPQSRPASLPLWMESPALLESWAYWQDWEVPLLKGRFFMIDSGAYSFMRGKVDVDLDKYLDGYIGFIQDHSIEHYFELDVDTIKGYEWVMKATKRMEQECPNPPIPVWHVPRGKAEFERMCKKYDYVAVGSPMAEAMVDRDIVPFFPWFIDTAHKHGCKIHGLGFTRMSLLPKLHFDSVDSTAWVGHSYGMIHYFDGARIRTKRGPDGYRGRYKSLSDQAIKEWIKFQRYAEVNL